MIRVHLRRLTKSGTRAIVFSLFVNAGCAGELTREGGSGAASFGGMPWASGGETGSSNGTGGNSGGSGGPGSSSSGGVGSTVCGTTEVRAVFAKSCTGGLCHDASAPAAELDLTVFDPAASMVDVPGTLCPSSVLVDAGSPSTSLLFTKVAEGTPSCGERMPVGAALDSASIDCIASWITRLATDPPTCETCGGATCTDLLADGANCGTCGHVCGSGEVCKGGVCTGCSDGETTCGLGCFDLMTSSEHCGLCGAACGAGQSCVGGECACDGGASVSFVTDVAPLLESGCAERGCHGGAMPKEGLDLRGMASFEDLVGVFASQCDDGRLLVEPGAPERSYLMQKLLGTDMCSGSLMPKGSMPFTASELATISSWICSGAPAD